MKKGIIKIATGVACIVLAVAAQAIPITGSIGFTGSAVVDDPSNPTRFNSINAVVLGGTQTGAYSSIAAKTPFNWTPFAFDSTSVTPLWTYTDSLGVVYEFAASSMTVNKTILNGVITRLTIQGAGRASITGYDTTDGTWTVVSSGGNSSFTFGASANVTAPTSVPDGGLTAALLGFSLLTLVVVRKKLAWF